MKWFWSIRPEMRALAFICLLAAFLAIVCGCAGGSNPDKLRTCKNVVLDAFHYPEEYQPGSSNYARILSYGVKGQNIGMLGPAQADCEAKYGD